jgi:hypothetical protein
MPKVTQLDSIPDRLVPTLNHPHISVVAPILQLGNKGSERSKVHCTKSTAAQDNTWAREADKGISLTLEGRGSPGRSLEPTPALHASRRPEAGPQPWLERKQCLLPWGSAESQPQAWVLPSLHAPTASTASVMGISGVRSPRTGVPSGVTSFREPGRRKSEGWKNCEQGA